jgi:hypothetical protein
MPYLTKAKVEHLRLSAKIEALTLLLARLDAQPSLYGYDSATRKAIESLRDNLVHMSQVIERQAQL